MAQQYVQPLPQISGDDIVSLGDQVQEMVNIVESRLVALENPVTEKAYDVSNFTEKRTLDAGSATATDVANFLATFVQDMIDRGHLKGTRRFD
jgi:hypothetical protein